MNKPVLSVLMPIYNVEPYLRQALTSVTTQTLQNLEIICINDGSTDNSLNIIREFMQQDPRIILIDKPNSGYGDSMNQGLKRAHGEYIGILEPDDWIEPRGFERLVAAAKRHRADVVKANYYKCTERAQSRTAENTATLSGRVLTARRCPELFQFAPAIWSAIYRRDFLRQNHITFLPTPGASYQDLSFSFKVWAAAERIVLLEDAFVHYRIDNSASSIHSAAKAQAVVDEYAEIETYLVERGLFADFAPAMAAARFLNYHWNFQRLPRAAAREFYFGAWQTAIHGDSADGLYRRPLFRRRHWLVLRLMLRSPRLAYSVLALRRAIAKNS